MQSDRRYALIFINWNSADLTLAAVRTIREQTGSDQCRLIVVDNGSADGSVEILQRELPEAAIIAFGENRGFAAAVNAGLQQVREPFAFVLNTDIEFRNDAAGILAEALSADPQAVLACPRLLRPDGSEQAAAVPEPKLLWELVNRSMGRRLLTLDPKLPTVVPGVVGPCMAVHMERLAQVGGLDERFFFFFEETDWCKRITDSGCHVLYVPQAEVLHLQGETANRRPVRARIQFYDSRYRFFHKHRGPLGCGVLRAGLWLKLTLDLLFYSVLVLLSLGCQRYRDKLAVTAVLWWWHLLGTRPRWGFDSRPCS
jgi:GT2 family glycosyltransferase